MIWLLVISSCNNIVYMYYVFTFPMSSLTSLLYTVAKERRCVILRYAALLVDHFVTYVVVNSVSVSLAHCPVFPFIPILFSLSTGAREEWTVGMLVGGDGWNWQLMLILTPAREVKSLIKHTGDPTRLRFLITTGSYLATIYGMRTWLPSYRAGL